MSNKATSLKAERLKHNVFILFFVAICVPLFFTVKHPSSWALTTTNALLIAKYFSAVLGYIGLALLTMEFALGTRAVSGVFFKDLSSKLSLHSKLGKYGVLFIFLHPILITYSYGEKFFYSFVPNINSQFERHVTFGRMAFLALLVIWVTSAILKHKIAYRPWKYIHYISYPALFASLLHVPEIGSNFRENYVHIYWIIIVITVLLCTALRMRHLFGYGKHKYEVLGHRQISEKIWVIDMKPVDKNLQIRTGQYVYLQPDLFSEEHPFSVLNHDDQTGLISIAYKVFGKFTEKLAKTELGDELLVDGPYGIFTEEINIDPLKPAVFIGGGIGVTPFVKHCLEKSGDRTLFYAVRTAVSPAFKDILQPSMGNNLVMVVEKDDTPATTNEERGFITKEILQKYVDFNKPNEFYICGPEKMMEAVEKILKGLGVPEKRIHIENFAF